MPEATVAWPDGLALDELDEPPRPAPHDCPSAHPIERLRPRRGVELTNRDVAVLADLTRCYGLTVTQVQQRHFGALRTAANRLAALARGGYVRLRRPWYTGPGVYTATTLGARVAGLGLPTPRFSRHSIGHHLVVADVADALLRAYPGAAWTPERELRSAAMGKVRERRGRLVDGVEHVPDGLLTLPFAGSTPSVVTGPAVSIAVEVELSAKGWAAWRRILGWYRRTLRYERVAWFCATGAIGQRLDTLIREEQLDDCMSVHALPAGVAVPRWD
jgi:hypothetical protein